MRGLLNKILYPGISITDYKSIQLEKGIGQQVYLCYDEGQSDVSELHWPLSLQPLVFGVWINKENHPMEGFNHYFLEFREKDPSRKLASIKLTLLEKIESVDGSIYLLKAKACQLFHTPPAESRFLYRTYFRKPGFTYERFTTYASAFSYPRKVRLVSFKNKDYYSIFPMDLIGVPVDSQTFVFGLRHTNQALKKILETRKLVVAEVSARFKKDIYSMGAYHSGAPPALDQLPFAVFPSQEFGFYVPSFADSYNEIEIMSCKDLGSHMLLLGRSIHKKEIHDDSGNLYHVHFLLSLLRQRLGSPLDEV
jgi:hypothetical protein